MARQRPFLNPEGVSIRIAIFRAAQWSFCALIASIAISTVSAQQPFDPSRGIVLHGTVVTMDAAGTILHNGNVLVRNGKIVATWIGTTLPKGTPIGDAIQIDLGSKALIFPGLINLHNHPTFDMLELWPAPTGRDRAIREPLSVERYDGRDPSPPEFRRLVDTPQLLLNDPMGLNLYPEVGKYAEIKAMLGGETAFQGEPADPRVDAALRPPPKAKMR